MTHFYCGKCKKKLTALVVCVSEPDGSVTVTYYCEACKEPKVTVEARAEEAYPSLDIPTWED